MRKIIKKIPKSFYALFSILIVIMSMTIVCASLSTRMLINGNADVRIDTNIRITNVEMINPTSGAYETVNLKYSKDTADLYSTLPNLDSTISFKVTIENKSNKVFVLSSIDETLSNDKITSNISEYDGTIIDKNSTKEITITYSYVDGTAELPADTTQTAQLQFNLEEPDASMIEYASEYTDKTNIQDAIDELFEIFE